MRERERLLSMLDSGKISTVEFEMLSSALQKKQYKSEKVFVLLFNPFAKVAGWPALIVGFFMMLALAFFGQMFGIHFPGVFDLQLIPMVSGDSTALTFSDVLLQNVISLTLLGCCFYGVATFGKIRGLRIQDCLGMVLLSRYPYLISTLILGGCLHLGMELGPPENRNITALLVISAIALVGLIWQGTTYFYALKESTGLVGRSLWLGYASATLGAEVISVMLTRFIL